MSPAAVPCASLAREGHQPGNLVRDVHRCHTVTEDGFAGPQGTPVPPGLQEVRERRPVVCDALALGPQEEDADTPTLPDIPQAIGVRKPDVCQEHLVERPAAVDGPEGPDVHAIFLHVEYEERQAAVLRDPGIGPGQENPPPRLVRHARPDLLTVDDPLVAVAQGGGAEAGQIRPRPGLTEELAPELLVGEGGPQPAPLELFRSEIRGSLLQLGERRRSSRLHPAPRHPAASRSPEVAVRLQAHGLRNQGRNVSTPGLRRSVRRETPHANLRWGRVPPTVIPTTALPTGSLST